MGFLNHSTNNIIIDAVLTEVGREALSEGGIRSQITSFTLGDDEVDYKILEQYGLQIGKEKIEKNTPIFEAITDERFAIKYPLRNLETNTTTVSVFPSLILMGSDTTFQLSSNLSSTTSVEINFKTFVNQDNDFILDDSVKDNEFTVKVFSKLLKLTNSSGIIEDGFAYYDVGATTRNIDFNGQVTSTIEISTAGVVTDSTFTYYSTSTDTSLIRTQVEITGKKSGAKLIIPVTITSNSI